MKTMNLDILLENTADGVTAVGGDGKIFVWNKAAESILGYTSEEAVGQLCRELFGGHDLSGNPICMSPCPIKGVLKQGDVVNHFEMATKTNEGKPIWIDVSVLYDPGDEHRSATTVHLFRDVTAAREIETLVRERLSAGKSEPPIQLPNLDEKLTQRELQILNLMRTGSTTSEMADELCISRATVRNHVQNIFGKLEVHNRLEAVALANGNHA